MVTGQAADLCPLGAQLTEWLSRLGRRAGVWEDAIQAPTITEKLGGWGAGLPLGGCFFLIFLNVYSFLRDRERQIMSGEGAEREGDTELKQAPGSEPTAQSPTWGSNPQTVRS